MKFRILLFSVLQDIAGGEEVEIECRAETVRVTELLAQLYAQHPGLKEWDSRIRVAADLEYVDRDTEVSSSQELAVMPPVQGG